MIEAESGVERGRVKWCTSPVSEAERITVKQSDMEHGACEGSRVESKKAG